MSDPVTNMEIEDVLSSIRRLVSGDERPNPAMDASPPARRAPERAEPERLVLTPSLRVDAARPQDAAEADPEQVPGYGADAVEMPPEDVDPSLMQDAGEVRDEAGTSAASEPEDGVPPHDRKAMLKARVAELEEVVSRQSDQWEPDGISENANSASPVAPLPWEDYVPDSNDDGAESPREASPQTGDSAPSEAPQETQPEAEDEGEDFTDNFAADDGNDTDGECLDDASDLMETSDEYLDEDALRDLIANIVREELQGALGERITRNVRKLVRREIHRALASHEFE
jgi:hypothetical protein